MSDFSCDAAKNLIMPLGHDRRATTYIYTPILTSAYLYDSRVRAGHNRYVCGWVFALADFALSATKRAVNSIVCIVAKISLQAKKATLSVLATHIRHTIYACMYI